jgi:hypothetical protein
MFTNFTANLLIAKLCFSSGSPGLYGYYAITTAIAFFLPILDLGIGQSIYNHFSRLRDTDFCIKTFKIYTNFLVKTALFWVIILISVATVYLMFNLQTIEYLKVDEQLLAFFVSLTIYIISIPMSSGFKILHSLSKIDKALLIQSIVSPLTLMAIYVTSVLQLELMPVAIVAPSIAFLISNLLAFRVAKSFFHDSISYAPKDSITWKPLLKTGFWAVILNLSVILSTFLPRLFLQNRDQSNDLDRYAFLLTLVTPFLSLTSLFAMKKSPDYRRLITKDQRRWLTRNSIISTSLAFGLAIVFYILVYLLPILQLPTLNQFETKLGATYILLHACYFLLLSSQTEKRDLKVFSFIFVFSIAIQTLINFNFVNIGYQNFLLLNVLLTVLIQSLGVGIYSYFFSNHRFLRENK